MFKQDLPKLLCPSMYLDTKIVLSLRAGILPSECRKATYGSTEFRAYDERRRRELFLKKNALISYGSL